MNNMYEMPYGTPSNVRASYCTKCGKDRMSCVEETEKQLTMYCAYCDKTRTILKENVV